MNSQKMRFAVLLLAAGVSGAAQAALHDRGGGLIYDDVLDVTWLADANYAQTSGYDADGLMTWSQANTWAANLIYGGYNDWRLPTVEPVNGSSFNYNFSTNGSTDDSENISAPGSVYPGSTASEMSYLYYVNLGNPGYFTPAGTVSGCMVSYPSNTCLDSTGPFSNLEPIPYWSGTEISVDTTLAWRFHMASGSQFEDWKGEGSRAWAVRDGDSVVATVPEADTWAMLLAGVGLVGWAARRRAAGK